MHRVSLMTSPEPLTFTGWLSASRRLKCYVDLAHPRPQESVIIIGNEALKVVDKFCCLGGTISQMQRLMMRSWHGSATPARLLDVYSIVCGRSVVCGGIQRSRCTAQWFFLLSFMGQRRGPRSALISRTWNSSTCAGFERSVELRGNTSSQTPRSSATATSQAWNPSSWYLSLAGPAMWRVW